MSEGGQQHRKLYYNSPVISRNTDSYDTSVMDKRLSTGNWLRITTFFNVNRTKEMIVDFRRSRNKPNTVSILGDEVEECTYPRVYLNKLDWKGIQWTLLLKQAQVGEHLHHDAACLLQVCGAECSICWGSSDS